MGDNRKQSCMTPTREQKKIDNFSVDVAYSHNSAHSFQPPARPDRIVLCMFGVFVFLFFFVLDATAYDSVLHAR